MAVHGNKHIVTNTALYIPGQTCELDIGIHYTPAQHSCMQPLLHSTTEEGYLHVCVATTSVYVPG